MLETVLREKRVVTCLGSGGVGKTTVAASLGVRAALDGRKVLVLTIDPARRLANSLGLSALGNVETRIGEEQFAEFGLRPRGELWAMTLDLRRTWDDLITRHAPTPERREKILGNRLYRQLSTHLAGSLEYMAMEKVYELTRDRDYELIVLDTPPTAHALDFLDAPNRLVDLIDNDAARLVLVPALAAGKLGLNLFNFGSSFVLRSLARFTGAELLRDLAEFLTSFQGMYDGFKERASATKALLAGPETGFVLVTSPQPQVVEEAIFFAEELRREGISIAALVANRVHEDPLLDDGATEPRQVAVALARARVPNEGHPPFSERLSLTIEELSRLATRDRREVEHLREMSGGDIALYLVPRLRRDVHDLGGLAAVGRELLGQEAGA